MSQEVNDTPKTQTPQTRAESSNDGHCIPFSIRFKVWSIQTLDRLKTPDESNRILVLLTAILGWVTAMVAVQSLITLCMYQIIQWTGHKLEGSWFQDVSVLVAALSGVLAYLPLLLLPYLKETLWGPDSWWCRPHAVIDNNKKKRKSSGPDGQGAQGVKNTKNSVDGNVSSFRTWWSVILSAALAAVVSFLLIQAFGLIARLVTKGDIASNDSSEGITEVLVQLFHGQGSLPWTVWVTIFITAFITPVLEEMLFRGVVTKSLLESSFAKTPTGEHTKMRSSMVCLVGGFVFGLTHLIGVASVPEAWLTLAGMTVLGWAFGLLDMRFRSVIPSMMSHVLYNCLVLGLMIASTAMM